MTQIDYIAVAGRPHRPFVTYLKRWLPKAVAHIAKPPKDVSIALVGNSKMAALHKQFLGIAGPTDVLSFELEHDSRGRVTAGEVVICVPYARREAQKRSVDVRHELLLYALHGMLHLSGYDDLDPKAYQKMHRKEDQILDQIGIGAIFNPREK